MLLAARLNCRKIDFDRFREKAVPGNSGTSGRFRFPSGSASSMNQGLKVTLKKVIPETSLPRAGGGNTNLLPRTNNKRRVQPSGFTSSQRHFVDPARVADISAQSR